MGQAYLITSPHTAPADAIGWMSSLQLCSGESPDSLSGLSDTIQWGGEGVLHLRGAGSTSRSGLASIHTWKHELVTTGKNEHPSTCLASFDTPPNSPHPGRTRVSPYSLMRVDTQDSCVELLESEVADLWWLWGRELESESLCARLSFPGPVARESRLFGILSAPIGISGALASLVPSPE